MTATRTLVKLRITHATSTVVIGHDHDGIPCIYVLSPTGWRLRKDPVRNDGQLVIDPSLIALLDHAAATIAVAAVA